MNTTTPLLRVNNLVKEFKTGRKDIFRAVDDVSFELNRRETIGIVGESGSGKSTTARMIARLIDPTSGTVEFEGTDITGKSGRGLLGFRSGVQVVFQDPYSSLNPRHTVEEVISAPLRYQKRKVAGGYKTLVKAAMERVGLNPDHSERYPRQFSGGQAQRIGIARALVVEPKLVICDEAVSALDVSVQAQVLELLVDLQRERDISYIFIAHDLAVVRQIAHKVAVMRTGKVVEQGARDEIFDHPREQYTQDLLAAVPKINAAWDTAREQHDA
ncbi:ATP-binding cassette domain-containing protein [Brevibacterium sp. 91QC2O2]|uniref:ATP-binding cassette domain-containing protein n=1 Tax=Brevibacterium TaxID=1696 RepID=UPI00211C7267|nr:MULTISPECIES: ATP-binding cassette domain-containing protein [unclassified Brevibacterium]MCQ9368755.1 ATP-binding cassette domain-containing protein [Brevibacterium sp. 91QC2O2]MCQ9386824.1 ATP-binding cassette domain-containing protein [Brevibacterium sp. 68QC2CO]